MAGLAFWMTRVHTGAAHRGAARYACPMHPDATADAPGECPICHMALEPIKPEARSTPKPASGQAHDEPTAREITASQTREAVNYVRFAHFESVRKRPLPAKITGPGWYETAGEVVVVLYKDEIAALETGEGATFFVARASDVGYAARAEGTPADPWDRSTARVRFRLEGDVSALSPGEPGWIRLDPKPREALVVPSSAVLESSEGPYVLISSIADRKFLRRPVEVGKVFSGMTTIVSGLAERETVVSMNAFFIDAEWQLRGGFDLGSGVGP